MTSVAAVSADAWPDSDRRADSLPATRAVVAWRLREDLEILPSDEHTDGRWTIKDPLRLTYFHVEHVELALLQMLNGRRSVPDLRDELLATFPDVELSESSITAFLATAIQAGLLAGCVAGHSGRLLEQQARERAMASVRRLTALLSWRVRGVDPTAVLRIIENRVGGLFRPAAVAGLVMLLVISGISVLSRWSQLQRELPELSTLFSATRLPLMILAIIVVKLLHELGHGLACRRFGGECHELGLLFVGFVPLLYCDVSDSWRFTDRRQRMLVSAAGILTELLLAAIAGLLWSITRPGMLHMFLLNVMLICSLNTLLVNGNPLLRYDGYYVLSDALNIPNLAGRSREALLAVFDRVVLGLASVSEGGSDRFRLWLPVWGLATTAYRLIVTIALLWLLHQTLRGVRLEFLTAGLLTVLVFSIAVTTARGIRHRVQRLAMQPERRPRAILGAGVFAAFVAALLLIPLPYSVTVPMSITAGVSVPLFVPEDARLLDGLAYGQHVSAGAVVAKLESGPLDWDVEHVRSELALAETRRDALLALRGADPAAANRLPAAEQEVQSAADRLEAVERRRESLSVVSPCDGLLLPPRNLPAVRNVSTSQPLESVTLRWSGRPLDRENRGAWLPATTPIGFVGGPQDLRAECLLRQQDVEWVAEGAEVQLTLASQPGHHVSGHVSRIQTVPETSVARELIVSRLVATDPHRPDSPADTLFAVHVAPADIPPDPGRAGTNRLEQWPPLYSTGRATIRCRPQSLSRRLWRFVCHTFTFER